MIKDIILSTRMETVARMVKEGNRVCDIGCDHAFVSIYLATKKIAPKVIASDVKTGPFDIARENIEKWKVSDVVDLRLGDGLEKILPGEVDTIIIAGMGGMLITDILSQKPEVVNSATQLVLQPQSEIEHVRRFIFEKGWFIASEKQLLDAGKYYVVLDVAISRKTGEFDAEYQEYKNAYGKENPLREVFFKYGFYLLTQREQVTVSYLEAAKRKNKDIAESLKNRETESSAKRLTEINRELWCIDRAMEYINS
jgi:tRNA (adenine22-N1)-methyltransferase